MANIKSSAKRNLLIKKAAAKNKSAKSHMKTSIKKFNAAVLGGDRKVAEAAYQSAVKTVDRAATKNLIHRNNAAHKKGSMAQALNTMPDK